MDGAEEEPFWFQLLIVRPQRSLRMKELFRAILCVGLVIAVFEITRPASFSQSGGYSQGGSYGRSAGQSNRYATTGSRGVPTAPRPPAQPAQARTPYMDGATRPNTTGIRAAEAMPQGAAVTPRATGSTKQAGGAEKHREAGSEGEAGGSERVPAPAAADALKLVPTQADVDYARPTPDEVSQLKVLAQKTAGAVGWVVEDARGTVLRRFLDTNGDGRIDQWCYFKDGLEVYRDIDSNFDGKVDQCRWFNTAGTRWGVDRDQDGVIDAWKAISAEEATQELIAALAKQDRDRFTRLLLTREELQSLGLGEAKAGEIAAKVKGAAEKFQTSAGKHKGIGPDAKWIQFSGTRPGLVPAGTEGSTKDVEVYEGVVAIVQSGSDHAEVPVGTLVRVGQAWRLIDAPELESAGHNEALAQGIFFRTPTPTRPQVAEGAASEKTQAMFGELEKIEAALSRAASPEEQEALNGQRADLLERLAAESGKAEDRAAWIRQLADTVSAAAQTGGYSKGVTRLEALWQRLAKEKETSLAAYVRFRQLAAEYGLAVQAKGADFAKIQADWLKKLEQFVADYPNSPDAAEAMLQLAIAQEFAGQDDEAKKWYGNIVSQFPDATVAKKAAGAKRRLDSVGKTIDFQGKSLTGELVELSKFRGKVVLIQFWATWCEPCKADMIVLKDLFERHNSGFAVIGVNLDNSAQAVSGYLAENRLPWPQIYEEGGLDSRPALELGILTLPTMILVDAEGKVVNRNVNATELAAELKKLLR